MSYKARQEMLYRTLGSTGEKVSAIGIGGWHIGLNRVDERLIRVSTAWRSWIRPARRCGHFGR